MNGSEALTAGELGTSTVHAAQDHAPNAAGSAGLGLHASNIAKVGPHPQLLPISVIGTGRDHSQGQGDWSAGLEDVLPRRWFVKQMQSEQRRSDRFKLPMSIALFRFDKNSTGLGEVHDLIALLREAKRETDVLGYLGEHLVGLLLTGTSEQGAEKFMQKLTARARDKRFTTRIGTYPGQNPETWIAESEERRDDSPLLQAFVQEGYPGKRTLDIIGSVVGIALCSPVMLLTALAIAVTSPGPVILKQRRLGKEGVPFVFYKFRSMRVNGDDRIHREYMASLINGDLQAINQGSAERPCYKIKSDPRVTAVGRMIRKTSIDELPQLFNVLKGQMSLVGPRPPLCYEAEKYQSWHLRRILEAKPGMTGLWQVQGRSKTSFDEMVRMDLRYVRSCSLLFDLKILLKTVKVVFRCEGGN